MKTVCIDFDGVLHSYESGWRGADVVSDDPVDGAINWLRELIESPEHEPCIYSSRSKEPGGIQAMADWLGKWSLMQHEIDALQFPTQKPAAFLTIDDRALRFEGAFPSLQYIDSFKPWNK